MRSYLDSLRSSRELHGAEAVLHTLGVPSHDEKPREIDPADRVFVTISRQAGAGGTSLAQALVERLNAIDPRPRPWSYWEREQVRKLAQTAHVPERLMETLEENSAGWFMDLLSGFARSDEALKTDEFALLKIVARAVYCLALGGRVVIVGRGGVYVTRGLPGGIHVRLVAPLEWRVAHMAREPGLTYKEAERRVDDIDRRRESFYRRHWPGQLLKPEDFTAMFNSAEVPIPVIADAIVGLVRAKAESLGAAAASTAAGLKIGHAGEP